MTTPTNHNTADQSGADERAKFEDWFQADSMPSESNWFCRDDDGDYYLAATSHAWNAWQARAALASTQPAPEPIAHIVEDGDGTQPYLARLAHPLPPVGTKLYGSPQPFPAPVVQSGELPDALSHMSKYWEHQWHDGDQYLVRISRDKLAEGIEDYARKAIAAQTAQAVAGEAWLPIETAPEGELVVCMWLDKEDVEHPARYNFDYFEDGIWMNYFSEHEHYAIAGVAKGRSEDAPYTHWMPLPAAPSQGAKQ